MPTNLKNDTDEATAELIYRFPHSCVNLEIVPDLPGSFGVRWNWQKGKTFFPFLETSPLRPIAEALIHGQRFPLFFCAHERRGLGKIALIARRNGVSFTALVEGREDQLSFTWTAEGEGLEALTLHLPLARGEATTLVAPDSDKAVAVWRNGVAATVAAGRSGTLTLAERGVSLFVEKPLSVSWEVHFCPARTEPEVRAALIAHLADRSDRLLATEEVLPFSARELMGEALAVLSDESRMEKPSLDRRYYREGEGDSRRYRVGEGADTARAAGALLAHYHLNGDDSYRRLARLLAHGLCDFQVTEVESPHWGAFWDAMDATRKPEDRHGAQTVGLAAAARASRGLHVLNAHFDTELLLRSGLAAAQWLLLKTDISGLPLAERFEVSGPPLSGGSPWAAGETMAALVETFRAAGNETYLKAALRSIGALRTRTADGTLRPETAPTEWLAATIESVLLVSREYENQDMVAFARQLGDTLRVRRAPDGWIHELDGRTSGTPLASGLAAGRAALALARVDDDPAWPLMALRVLRAARQRHTDLGALPIADLAGLSSLPLSLLLALGARPKAGVADFDKVQIKRGWQTFEADPATYEYVTVTDPDGKPVDALALVCQASLQVQVAVLGPSDLTEVRILKNGRAPYVRNLLTGGYDQKYPLEPLGDGKEARFGVFVADT